MSLKHVFKNKIFLTGFIILIIGSGPLFSVMIAAAVGLTSDPNPNPVIFGMMAGLTFWPALILMAIGWYNQRKEVDSTHS